MPVHATLRNSMRLGMTGMVFVVALAACSGSAATAPPIATPAPASTPAPVAATTPVAATPAAAATPGAAATPSATKARPNKTPKGAATPAPAPTAAPVSTAAPAPTLPPISTGAGLNCPTAGTVGSALGISVSNPSTVPGGTGTSLPSGAKGVACDYRGAASNVIIELISNIAPSYISQFSEHFPVPYKNVSGVGDQARSFLVQLNGGKDNEGVVATRGSMLVAITATATPATLTQVEGLVSLLL